MRQVVRITMRELTRSAWCFNIKCTIYGLQFSESFFLSLATFHFISWITNSTTFRVSAHWPRLSGNSIRWVVRHDLIRYARFWDHTMRQRARLKWRERPSPRIMQDGNCWRGMHVVKWCAIRRIPAEFRGGKQQKSSQCPIYWIYLPYTHLVKQTQSLKVRLISYPHEGLASQNSHFEEVRTSATVRKGRAS